MRTLWMATACLISLLGCHETYEYVGELGELCDMGHSSRDLSPAPPPCPAAKGLSGDNLLCVDFANPQTTIASLTAKSWNFSVAMSSCPGWTVASGQLQVTGFASFANGSCGFLMQALSANDYQKYNSFTLSVIHRVDISEVVGQKVQVMLGADDPLIRLVTQWTGKEAQQQSIMAISKGNLPNAGSNMYQPLFKISSTNTAGGGYRGWQIDSIAVNGVP